MPEDVFSKWKDALNEKNGEDNTIEQMKNFWYGPCDESMYSAFDMTHGDSFKIRITPNEFINQEKKDKQTEKCKLHVLSGNQAIGNTVTLPLQAMKGYYWEYDFAANTLGVANTKDSKKPSVALGATALLG